MSPLDKPLTILSGELKTPPMSEAARIEAGHFLRLVQKGLLLSLPHSRPMPSIGAHCHELRIVDENKTWRVIYRIGATEILVVDVFAKKTQQTPNHVIEACKKRLREWDND